MLPYLLCEVCAQDSATEAREGSCTFVFISRDGRAREIHAVQAVVCSGMRHREKKTWQMVVYDTCDSDSCLLDEKTSDKCSEIASLGG